MNFINGLRSKFRWWLLKYLERFERTCTASLVSWAMSPEYHDFLEINPYRVWYKETIWKQICSKENGVYCGKCILTGRIDGDESNLTKQEKQFIRFPFNIKEKEIYIKFGELE